MTGGGRSDPPSTSGRVYGGGSTLAGGCNITETTTLNSPQADVIEQLEVGGELSIVVRNNRLVACDADGRVAGSITSANAPRILRCITEEGFSYIGRVLELDDGLCVIQIEPSR